MLPKRRNGSWQGRAARPPRSCRIIRPAMLALLVLTTAALMSAVETAPAPALTIVIVKPSQELAVLFGSHQALLRPSRHSTPVNYLQARRPITGERTVLPVLGHKTSADGLRWLQVELPGRPNGRTGWIRKHATVAATTRWHIVVDTSRRRVIVYKHARPVRVFRAIVGKPSTPTPIGRFFVEESIRLRPGAVGTPYALALSARSNVLQEFDGGPGQIAMHGLANVGGILGSAVSHGCIRLNGSAMSWLAVRIGPGTPVTITG
jgi:lipoprotein-anchoring transpeptidase ErfK/SrfK